MALALDRGIFTLSLDFELAWGSRDVVRDLPALERMALITREAVVPPMVEMFRRRGVVATWATVGHLFLDTEGTEPAYAARSLVLALREAGQELGSHSFEHPVFGQIDEATADRDLARCVTEARALGVELRSFVFPRNVPGHVGLLKKHGFRTWRPPEPAWYKRRLVPGPAQRLAHLVDVARAARPPTVMPWRDEHGLCCLPASATFLPIDGVRRAIPMRQRVRRATRGIDEAVRSRRVSHLYTHPINLATDPAAMLAGLGAVIDHAARCRDRGELDILSMDQVADRLEG